jgi:hypothetical protein
VAAPRAACPLLPRDYRNGVSEKTDILQGCLLKVLELQTGGPGRRVARANPLDKRRVNAFSLKKPQGKDCALQFTCYWAVQCLEMSGAANDIVRQIDTSDPYALMVHCCSSAWLMRLHRRRQGTRARCTPPTPCHATPRAGLGWSNKQHHVHGAAGSACSVKQRGAPALSSHSRFKTAADPSTSAWLYTRRWLAETPQTL